MLTTRCLWAKTPLEIIYHDTEWGVPMHDDKQLFEYFVLDTFQAGLSWAIILNKREGFRRAFDNFDAEKMANYDEAKLAELLLDQGIIRNKLKLKAVVTNAAAFLNVQAEFGSFDAYIWQFTNHKTISNQWASRQDVPATSPESDAMAHDLKKRGFKFCGTTICYAFMQATGMINDHTTDCFRYTEVG
jgi:DNA-3-methyladenine glycosylase I